MQKIALGYNEDQISCIGLGTMYFGTKIGEKSSFKMLDFYEEKGGGLLDSANKYASWVPGFQGGESEKIIGKWMKEKGNRQKMFITSKVGFPYGNIPRSLKKEIIVSECEKSLKGLGVETIDLFFAHAFDVETHLEETMDAFRQLKQLGKIRFAGASNFYGWQLSEANSIALQQGWEGFCCLQQRHTFLEPGLRADFGTQLVLTPEIQELCAIRKITLMAYSPLLGGAYVRDELEIPVQYQSAANDSKMANLRKVANEMQVSVNAVILAWMGQGSPSIIPIVTGSSVAQLRDNFQCLLVCLSEKQMELLNQQDIKANKYS